MLEKGKTESKVQNCINKNKGITLVALVVTITVLVILARSKYIYNIRR